MPSSSPRPLPSSNPDPPNPDSPSSHPPPTPEPHDRHDHRQARPSSSASSSVSDIPNIFCSAASTFTTSTASSSVPDGAIGLPPPPTVLVPPPALLYLSFNQNYGCFTAGTSSGFRIYSCDPFREMYRRENSDLALPGAFATYGGGGIGVAQMLFRSNYQALVGGGPKPQFPLNKVMIWDDSQFRCVGELSFRSQVKSVRLRRDSVVVALLQKIFVYGFPSLKLEYQIETVANPRGLCEVSQTSTSRVLVCPGLQKGQVRVEHYTSRRTKYIAAHDSTIACLALTNDGRFLATASSKGTLIRVHNTLDGSLLQEVRRGADRAEIYSLSFSSTAQWLAVSSDKGTVHVFNLKFDSGSLGSEMSRGASEPNNSALVGVSHLSFIKGVLPKYFSSEWSVAQFRLQEGLQSIVAFGHQKNTVVILGMDGSFFRCQFDPVAGGEMKQLEHHNFLTPEESF